jgi:hypothetical protein
MPSKDHAISRAGGNIRFSRVGPSLECVPKKSLPGKWLSDIQRKSALELRRLFLLVIRGQWLYDEEHRNMLGSGVLQ